MVYGEKKFPLPSGEREKAHRAFSGEGEME